MKSYTDIEQSKVLATILPLESADMYWSFGDIKFMDNDYDPNVVQHIPCWSLAALLDVLLEGTRLLKATNISSVGDIKYHCECPKINIDKWFNNSVDACVEMVLKLHEHNLL